MIYFFLRCKCYFDCNATSETTIVKSFFMMVEMSTWENRKVLFFIWWYSIAIDMLFLTDKLNITCCVLYETKELLTIKKMYNTIINILIFIISIDTVINIIIVIIIITVTIINNSIILHSSNLHDRYVKFLCHMTSDVKFFAHHFFFYLFFVQKLQHSMN